MGNSIPIRSPFHGREGEVEDFNNSEVSYQFPPMSKSGSYFANHFVMAGEKFENMNQQTFLFGENNDLNYLPKKPTSFPYPIANENEPSNTIRCFVHLRKESLKLVKEVDDSDACTYRVEFVFDADLECAVRIFLMATEEYKNGTVVYTPRNENLVSDAVTFKKGTNQIFDSKDFVIQPTDFTPSELNYIPGGLSEIPLVIQITVEDSDFLGQSESTLAGIEVLSDGLYTMKFLKQKIMTDGVCFMMQDIYGIENKTQDEKQKGDDLMDDDDNCECVICMGELRDTIMLPCRHLCLCSMCAEEMRNKQSRCPICRANFHALLQIRAVREKRGVSENVGSSAVGLEDIPIIEALNGMLDVDGNTSETVDFKRQSSRSSAGSRRSNRRRSAKDSSRSLKKDVESYNTENDEQTQKDLKDLKSPSKRANNITKVEREEEAADQVNQHFEEVIPGTPMGSQDSNESLSVSMTGSTSLLLASGSSLISTRAQITTPSNVRVDESPASPEKTDDPSIPGETV